MVKLVSVVYTASVWSVLAYAAPPMNGSAFCQHLIDSTTCHTTVLAPGKSEYDKISSENWSRTSQLSPLCILEPETPQEVADAVKLLSAAKVPFAVRSGGHMPVPEAANIDDGILISLHRMRTMQLVDDGAVAQLGPGLRWEAVYDWVSSYGLAVVGGRYGPVGVSGLLLGGGVSFFGSQYGWATNMISNLQVVLANGDIVDANLTSHPDLFWALKGGSSNYGIVTRFDVHTFPLTQWYGGQASFDPVYIAPFIDAVAAYVSPGGGSRDSAAHLNPSVQVQMSTGETSLIGLFTHREAGAAPAAFANFTSIPTLSDTRGIRSSLANLTADTSSAMYGARTARQLFYTTSLRASERAVALTSRTFFETMAAMRSELQNVPGLVITSSQQPISKAWLEAARDSGGDAIDIDPADGPLIIYLIGTSWDNAADDELVHRFNRRCIETIERRAKKERLYHPFVYVNDAAAGQKPLATYGSKRSRLRMREIRSKYDHSCVFQKLMPGGFKLGC